MDLFAWLSTSLNRYRNNTGFRFECMEDGVWLCRLCNERVMDTQMGFHAAARHGFIAPNVRITPRNGVPL